jgi:hypothetical protein
MLQVNKKTAKIFFVGLGVIILIPIIFIVADFGGAFDITYTRDELNTNFHKNEKDFKELGDYFLAKIPSSVYENYYVDFKLNKRSLFSSLFNKEQFSIFLTPKVIDPKNKLIGGADMESGSPKLDSALTMLGWKNENLYFLRDKLAKTHCGIISTSGIYGGEPILLSPHQTGWGCYTYMIFPKPLADSVLKVHGRTISNSAFGRRVVLQYSSAL